MIRDLLFEPIYINTTEIKNRILMPAMHLMMGSNYHVSEQMIDFYAERAKGGAGMIVVGCATINDVAGGMLNMIGAHRDEYIPGLARLAATIKKFGARCAVQLNHCGANAVSSLIGGKQPVAPSDVPGLSGEDPRPLTKDEIAQTIRDFGSAARRVREAGFDAVEVLSAGGYLISEFLSPLTNKREDAYGGTQERRMKFGIEVLQSVKQAVGNSFPVLTRINGNEFMQGGLGRKDLQCFAKRLVKEGSVDALNVAVGWHQTPVPQVTGAVPRGMYAYLAKGIRDKVDVPVIASHRINTPESARELLEDGMCDMVAVARGLIADPLFPAKARSGNEKEIIHCIACAQGCLDGLFRKTKIECLCNPKAGHEKDRQIKKSDTPKKVMVVGGGPAGMSTALAANERGHDVVLFERASKLGGQLHLAAAPSGREEFEQLAFDLSVQLKKNHIKTFLNRAVDKETILNENPDVVILACGAHPIKPNIPGIDTSNVVDAWDVLAGKKRTGRRIVIIGGGAVGVETAIYLADKGTLSAEAVKFLLVNQAESCDDLFKLATRGTKEIILIEMIDRIGRDIGKTTRWGMLQQLTRYGVKVRTETIALGIEKTGVRVKTGEMEEMLDADTVVIAVGSKPENSLEKELSTLDFDYKVVGDAQKIAQAFEAIHDGFIAGREI